jgi:hypothetical protein
MVEVDLLQQILSVHVRLFQRLHIARIEGRDSVSKQTTIIVSPRCDTLSSFVIPRQCLRTSLLSFEYSSVFSCRSEGGAGDNGEEVPETDFEEESVSDIMI